jgi:23S rRNA (pseudouridine1915-N3)-methyltransferase
LKEPYLKEGERRLLDAVSKRIPISVQEAPEERAPEKLSEAGRLAVLEKEGLGLLRLAGSGCRMAALAAQGRLATSEDLRAMAEGSKQRPLVLVIGGSLGLGRNVMERADDCVSFSRLTFPHQLMRLILLDALSEALSPTAGAGFGRRAPL